jgi:hypothetical protein
LIDAEIERTRKSINPTAVASLGENNQPAVASLGGRERGPTYSQRDMDRLNELKAKAALNSHLPIDEVRKLVNDESPIVRAAALRNKNLNMTTEEIGQKTSDELSRTETTRDDVIKMHKVVVSLHPDDSIYEKMSMDLDRKKRELEQQNNEVLRALALNPRTSAADLTRIHKSVTETEDELKKPPAAGVSPILGQNAHYASELKETLAVHADKETLESMATRLATDEDEKVRRVLNEELKKKGLKLATETKG